MMRLLDISYDTPEMNLALDEVLLDSADRAENPVSTLRFWESSIPFIVLGTGQVVREEVYLDRCEADGMPLRRRCSAGGCVLQGPGSLNFNLTLICEDYPEVKQLRASYCYILHKLSEVFAEQGLDVQHLGISDMVMGDKKVSGNAQRRRRRAILHHGTLLYRVDYDAMAHYLREPEDRPEYRGKRPHQDFVTALPLEAATLRQIVQKAFAPEAATIDAPTAEEIQSAEKLAVEKYADEAWIFRR